MIFNSATGKRVSKQRHKEIKFCKFNSNGRQVASNIEYTSIYVSDSIRGHTIKVLKFQEYKNSLDWSSLKFEKDLVQYVRDDFIEILDTTSTRTAIKVGSAIQLKNAMFSQHPEGRLIAVKKNKETIAFRNLYDTDDSAIQKRKTTKRGIKLKGVLANLSVGLSEDNIMLFIEKGEYYPFDETTIRGMFSNSPIEEINIPEISLADKRLSLFHIRIIDSYAQWSTLKKLDLTNNNISDKGGEIIGNNKS